MNKTLRALFFALFAVLLPNVASAQSVARIGSTEYATLADAIADVPTNGTKTTIAMIANETVAADNTMAIAATKNIVLDLNGKTITGSSTTSSPNFYFITNKGTLEITDNSEGALGKITYGCSAATYSNEYVTICNEGGTFTLTNGKIENTSGGLSYAVNNRSVAQGIATFNLNGGTISAPSGDAAIRVYQSVYNASSPYDNIVNVTGGTILNSGIFVDSYIGNNVDGSNSHLNVNISGGTVNGLIDYKLRHPYNIALNITGGDFENAKLWVRKYTSEYKPSTEPTAPIVHISGGKFSFENNKAFGLAYDCGATSWTSYTQPYDVSGGVFNVDLNNFSGIAFPEGKTGVANTDPTTKTAYPYTVGSEFVAQIGETKYATLAEAIADVPTDGTETTITMIADETINVAGSALTIAAGKNVVLELNGKEVTGVCTTGTASALITNNGTLKIQDNTDTNKDGTGQGKMYAGANPAWIYEGGENYAGSYASNMISNRGNLTIESGYFESTTSGSAAYIIDNYTNGIAVINGGHLYNYHTNAIRLFCNSTSADNSLTVNGGIIEGYCAIWVQGASQTTEKGSLTINGGTFRTTEKAVVNGTKTIAEGNSYIYVWPSNSNMSFTITGGTFDTNIATWGNGSVSISGGTFNGYVYSATQTAFITGGTFAEDVSEYCADGYAAADNNNGAWKVGVVSTTALTPQAGATETEATYTASTVVTDENNVEYPLSTNQEVNVSVPETGNAGKDVTLADFDINEVVTKAVAAANETTEGIDVQLIIKAAAPVVSGETVTFEVHPEAVVSVNGGTPTSVELTNADLASGSSFTFELDVTGKFENGANVQIVHKSAGYADETYYATVIGGKVTVMGITHFSDFELSEITPAAGMVAVNLTTGVQYASLADAIAAVPTNGTATTIAMLDNEVFDAESKLTVATGKNIVLDLNGKTITGSNNSTGNFYFITNNGTLEITDNSASGEGQILFQSTKTDYSNERVTIYNLGGTLTLTKGLVKNTTAGGLAYAINNSSNAWGSNVISTFNLNGGRVSAPNGDAALRVYQNCAPGSTLSKNYVNITGGTLDETGIFVDQILYTGGSTDLTTYTGSNIDTQINISGGTVNGLIDMKIRHPFNTSLNITGGDFNNTQIWVRKVSGEYANACGEPTAPMVTISGGDFDFAGGDSFGLAYGYASTSWSSYDKPYNISGGTYDLEVPAQYCADGYEPTDEVAGKYSVQVIDWGSKNITLIDGTSYEDCVGMPVTADVTVYSASYVRTVRPNFCAWYVPFNYTLTSSDINDINFYRINLIANAVAGTEVTSTDQIWVYLTRMEAGETLTANRPYVFKAKSGSWEQTFTTSGATLCAPTTDSRLENSTTANRYDFYGTYATTTTLHDDASNHYFYVDYYGEMSWPGSYNVSVGPYRWYIKATQKGGGAYYAPSFIFTDNSDVTGISNDVEFKTVECYYDLKGRKIEKPAKGAYLVKFTDGSVRKVVK